MTTEKYIDLNAERAQRWGATQICVTLDYRTGGHNYWTGKSDGRGYYLHIQPCIVKRENGFRTVQSIPTDGGRMLLAEVGRRSDRKQAELWAKIEAKAENIAELFADLNMGGVTDLVRGLI